MKRLICAVCLLILLVLSVPAVSESFILPTENEDILLLMNQIALASDFDYEKLWYYQPTNSVCIYVAEDGFAAVIAELLEQEVDETYEPWVEFKEGMTQAYESIIKFCAESGFEDVDVTFSFVNDDIYMRNDDSNLSATGILSFRNGELWFDLLFERSMTRLYSGE